MAGALRKTMVYLGLAEEDERYDYDDFDEPRRDRMEDDEPERVETTRRVMADVDDEDDRDDEPVARREHVREADHPVPVRRTRGGATLASVAPAHEDESPRRAEVTPLRRTPIAEVANDVEVTGVHRITTIHPRTYNEAKKIGESFRQGTPVIMNLSDLEDADAKRLVDFAAGLVFGLAGSIERVTNKVFLLSPSDVEVTTEDGEPSRRGSGLFDQG